MPQILREQAKSFELLLRSDDEEKRVLREHIEGLEAKLNKPNNALGED